MPKSKQSTDKVTRLEVINYLENKGRQLVIWDDNAQIELSLQDDGRTLKIFVNKRTGNAKV